MVEGFAHGRGIARLEDNIPETIGEAVAFFHPLGAVMIEMMPLDIAEIRASEVVKVYRVVNPFLRHIALYDSGQKDWKSKNRSNKTYRRGHKEQR